MAELGVGQKITYFELPDQQDYPWSLSGQLELGPILLVFYRGDWSPYCNGQLASYARQIAEFEGRGIQVVGISVDPPSNNAAMVGKLQLPFPLLSDPEGELARYLGLWDATENLAVPSVILVDQSGEVHYMYKGTDFADRPTDEEVFAALKGFEGGIERITGGPQFQLGATRARERTVRPDKRAMELEELISYYKGVLRTIMILHGRFGTWGRSGKRALGEVDAYQKMVNRYIQALNETIDLKRQSA